ncbi:hypothetical protein [Devosia sp. Leaf64]|uniref:hypothetical protein n=1 Tax=Devosia sp. Leaf64 TaxID=1736229 RepID=UPI0007154C13|nr:hypothetical protein [Devosia sp. Leaf64]KQN72229.1 hypothetical protein ASE94_06790 [Devosia sp. Leaf64]
MNAGLRRHPLTGSTRHVAAASAADRVSTVLRLAGTALFAGLVVACASRPVGDFGRAQPSVLHDNVLPAVGTFMARQREPVSNFNQTDQEREMHNRTWRFLVAAQADDWMFDTQAEMQRTRIARPKDFTFTTDRYYSWLKRTYYQSSRVRYATLNRHVLADLDTMPTTFASICAVIEVDRNRAVALASLTDLEPGAAENVAARKYENDFHIEWFVRAVNYRYESYSYALDNLLVETPHEQSITVDASLEQLSYWAGRATRHDFCGDPTGQHARGSVTIPSRFQTMVPDLEVIDQK